MESIGDPSRFLAASNRAARTKPIILLKSGRTAASAHAAISHTGALAGNDAIFSAAMRQGSVLRVDSLSDFYGAAMWLSRYPLPAGPDLTIVTNAGGPGVVAADDLILHSGKLSPLSLKIMKSLDAILPPFWSHNNPIDILGNADGKTYEKAMRIAVGDPKTDAVLAILTPQDMTDPIGSAKSLQKAAMQKPVIASWMGSLVVGKGKLLLRKINIPSFDFPDAAAKTFAMLAAYRERIGKIAWKTAKERRVPAVEKIIQRAKREKRTILNESESKQILQSYGIDVIETKAAASLSEAVGIADQIGYPVVLKVLSRTITHKAEVGGVKLNLGNAKDVIRAFHEIKSSVGARRFQGVTVEAMVSGGGFELFFGSLADEQFGPVILFGVGGRLVEAIPDKVMALPPVTEKEAFSLLRDTKLYRALSHKINWKPIASALTRFSRLAAEQQSIKECDINPLVFVKDRLTALDARIILFEEESL